MANAWQEVDLIASEALMHLEDALVIANLTSRDASAEFNATPNGYAIGDTIRMRTNPEYESKEFTSTIDIQSIKSSTRNMTVEKHFDVSVAVGAKEKVMDLESFSDQVIKPAAYVLAESVEQYLATKLINAAGMYASDDLFTTRADMAAARREATEQRLSATGRFCLVGLDVESTLLGADYFTTYNNRGEDGSKVFRDASMGHAMNMDFFASVNFPETVIITGDPDGIITNHPAGDNELIGSLTLPFDGGSASVDLKVGDRLKVSGMVTPLIVAVATTSDSGNITLKDPITSVVPDGAAITVIGAGNTVTTRGAIFDDRSMAMAMPILDPADDMPSFVVSNNGVSIRVVQGYDLTTKTTTMSMDLLVGAEAWDPRKITLLADF